ncbi:MAG: helix-turn-helix transcriptional regulator [Treponema sp.]|nr:helix-turn-helix transcriptional regulator [Treponema sp.]MBP5697502.1 helix-turn-helix transcriptional regulator [Treponema sp.]MBQ1671182.1 helix-turn-helix transcriptional regulator [Treponema sp.]MBQ1728479.1 helix-turn-helix transcriptional regulator [Treponema sp.]MBQ2207597.1 helix-turn-helix transcriptional regulator [Treponema sp.]
MNIGQAIITIRKEKNLSQEQLAFEAGISRHFMYRLENNLASPTIKTLEKLSAALNIRPSAILLEAEKIS